MTEVPADQERDAITGLYPGPGPRSALLLAVALAAVLFAVLFGDPATFATRHVGESAYGAFQTTMWNYWYVGDHLLEPSALLRSDLQYHPFGVNVYVRIGNLLDIVLYQPFRWLLGEVPARNAFAWLVLWLDGLAMAWAARRLSGHDGVALAAGLLLCLSRYLLEELFWGRLTNLMVFAMPLFLVAWHEAVHRGGLRRLLVAAGLLALAGLSYIYYGVFLAGAVAVLAPFQLLGPGHRVAPRRWLASLGVLVGVTGVLVAPFAWPFLDPSIHEGVASFDVFGWGALEPPAMTNAGSLSWYWNVVMPHSLSLGESLRRVGPVAVLGLAVALAARPAAWRRVLPWLVLAAVAWVLSLGPYLVPPEAGRPAWVKSVAHDPPWRLPGWWLHARVPFFDRFGHPERFSLLAGMAAVLGASAAAGAALRGRRPRVRLAVGALAVALVLGDRLWVERTEVLHTEPLHHSRFFHDLAAQPDPGSMVSLPIQASDFICDHQRIHAWPLLNGYGSMFRIEVVEREAWLEFTRENTVWRYLEQAPTQGPDQAWPRPEDWAFFRDNDVRYATLHARAFGEVHTLKEGRIGEEGLRRPQEHARARLALEQLLGPPVFRDDRVEAWDLARAATDPPRPPAPEAP